MKFLRESNEEPDDFSRRINQIIELNEDRDEVHYKLNKYQIKMKSLFDKKASERDFRQGDLVLRWNARREDKMKHGKFDNLWLRPFSIAEVKGNTLLFCRMWRRVFLIPCQWEVLEALHSVLRGFHSFIIVLYQRVLFYMQCVFVSTETPLARGEGTWICKFSATYKRKWYPVGVDVVTSFIFDKLVFIL